MNEFPRGKRTLTFNRFLNRLPCEKKQNSVQYHVEMMVIRVADGQVAAVQIHLPSHLLRTVLLYLLNNTSFINSTWLLLTRIL